MIAKLMNMIKRAVVTNPGDDSGEFPVTQVSYLGKAADIETIFPYGMSANMPKDSIVLLFNVQAQEENRAGIGYRHDLRPKNLKEGEVVFGNFLKGTTIFFDADGNIKIVGDVELTGNLDITGDMTLTGDMDVTGDVAITGAHDVTGNATVSGTLTIGGTNFATHTHSGVTSGSSNTGPPT
jgi:hypothetical protein